MTVLPKSKALASSYQTFIDKEIPVSRIPKQYAQKYFQVSAISHSTNLALEGLYYSGARSSYGNANVNPLAVLARLTWPISSHHWIDKIFLLSPAMLDYIEELPNRASVVSAGNQLAALNKLNLYPKCVSAMGDGGICLAWPLAAIYADICCFNDGEVIMNYRIRGSASTSVENPSFDDLRAFSSVVHEHD
jgi:hypothetical protein